MSGAFLGVVRYRLLTGNTNQYIPRDTTVYSNGLNGFANRPRSALPRQQFGLAVGYRYAEHGLAYQTRHARLQKRG